MLDALKWRECIQEAYLPWLYKAGFKNMLKTTLVANISFSASKAVSFRNFSHIVLYSVFESFEDNAAQVWQLPQACPTAQSRNLVPISLENPVDTFIMFFSICLVLMHR